MSSHQRVLYRNVPGATEILTPDFLDFLASLDDAMHAQLAALRTSRAKRLRQALRDNMPLSPKGKMCSFVSSSVAWQ
jgi:hypothetical protein